MARQWRHIAIWKGGRLVFDQSSYQREQSRIRRRELLRAFERVPYLTILLVAAMGMVFLVQAVSASTGLASLPVALQRVAAEFSDLFERVAANRQWLRSIPAAFSHADLIHLSLNAAALIVLGITVELRLSAVTRILLYVVFQSSASVGYIAATSLHGNGAAALTMSTAGICGLLSIVAAIVVLGAVVAGFQSVRNRVVPRPAIAANWRIMAAIAVSSILAASAAIWLHARYTVEYDSANIAGAVMGLNVAAFLAIFLSVVRSARVATWR